ncbi:hypothetical protein MUP35_02395 [Patescibacteria group bacterium]|nr:hypothetical protein [Patescibacteria group bacterium]
MSDKNDKDEKDREKSVAQDFIQRGKLLEHEAKDIECKLRELQVEMLKWLGKKIQNFLRQSGNLYVNIGYVFGHRNSRGINPSSTTYHDFSQVSKAIFPITEDYNCLWLKIEFTDGLDYLHFEPEVIVLTRRIDEKEMEFERLSMIYGDFVRDFSLYLKMFGSE